MAGGVHSCHLCVRQFLGPQCVCQPAAGTDRGSGGGGGGEVGSAEAATPAVPGLSLHRAGHRQVLVPVRTRHQSRHGVLVALPSDAAALPPESAAARLGCPGVPGSPRAPEALPARRAGGVRHRAGTGATAAVAVAQ